MSKKIGLKLADGEFYPVLDDGNVSRKRLVVTTVQDGQRSVQIDLYRGSGERIEGAEYIGSLVVEGIPEMAKGEPDVRLELGLSEDGTLTARAEEAATGASQSLKVSLEALSEEEKYEIPDFEFSDEAEESVPSVTDFSDEDFAGTDELPSQEESARLLADDEPSLHEEAKPRRRILLIVLFALAVLVVALGLGYLVYRLATGIGQGGPEKATTVTAAPPAPAVAAAPPPAQATAAAAVPAPAPAPAQAAPAKTATTKAPAVPAAKAPGVYYTIRWGDTLWDLSYAFYRNPWLYGKIATANKIRNPDLIISGHKIWIPPR